MSDKTRSSYCEEDYRVSNNVPGSLAGLYEMVVRGLKNGEDIPAGVILRLLERMGPPKKLTTKQMEKLKLLKYIETLRMFYFEIKSGDVNFLGDKQASFRAACLMARERLNERSRESLNKTEASFLDKDEDDFIKQISEIKKGRRFIK